MKLIVTSICLLVGILASQLISAQPIRRQIYRAIVYLADGDRLNGIAGAVDNGVLYFDPTEAVYAKNNKDGRLSVELADVERVVLRRVSNRRAIRTGAVVGGALGGFLALESVRKNGFRSPLLGGVSVALAIGALGAAGALVGSAVGKVSRRVIRPIDRDNPVESMERQLQPFTRSYQDKLIPPVIQ